MAVDLKSRSNFGTRSIVLEPDVLILLDHATFQDRVRRVYLDRVDYLLFQQRFYKLGMVILIALVIAGSLLMATGNSVAIGFSLVLWMIAAYCAYQICMCRVTTLRIGRAGQIEEIHGVFNCHKFDTFVARLESHIQNAQKPQGVETIPEP